MFDEELKKIREIEGCLDRYRPVIERVEEMEAEIRSITNGIKIKCAQANHPNAYVTRTETDSYEQRTYAHIWCPDCEECWEERVRCGILPRKRKEDINKNT